MNTRAGFRILPATILSVLALAANAVSQETVTAQVPVVSNIDADIAIQPPGGQGRGASGKVTAGEEKIFDIELSTDGLSASLPIQASAGPLVSYSNGNVTLSLGSQSWRNAVISLHSLNGRQILRNNISSNEGRFSLSGVPAGVYLLSVKGEGSNFFVTKLTHGGNGLNINAAYSGEYNSPLRKPGDYGTWTITASPEGYNAKNKAFAPDEGENPLQSFNFNEADKEGVSIRSSSSRGSEFSGSSSSRNSSSSVSGGSSSSRGSSSSVGNSSSSRVASSSSRPSGGSSASFVPLEKKSFTETVGNVSFDMVYVPGATFTIGCESGSCPADTKPVSGVKVNNYFIGKTEVSTALWNAVMGRSGGSNSTSHTSNTWYDAMEFACKLSELTGKNYRMTTEAEWEYAAKNHRSSLDKIGGGSGVGGEEWAYNSWLSTHDGGEDPVGPSSGGHTQKTRRDANTGGDNITARLIRSIEGIGPALRLSLSADVPLPSKYVSPCDLHAPHLDGEPENSYRDPRWVTGSGAQWEAGGIAIGNFSLRVWEDGTARLGSTNGQWFTSNNIAFVFVPSSGSSGRTKFAYIFLDESQGSLISDKSFMSGGFIGRIEKKSASNYDKPTISGLKSGAELAAEAGDDFKMVDMENIPQSARKQDSRLLDGTSQGWFQDNRQAGGVHHYRKDVDADEFRFTVNQLPSSSTMLANGTWFTVNNTFLRVTHKNGYTAEYLYAVDSDGTFYHNSFMGYERGDFRMFKKTANAPENSSLWSSTCGSLCSGEIKKDQAQSFYAQQDIGKSTFVPAKCPASGCR